MDILPFLRLIGLLKLTFPELLSSVFAPYTRSKNDTLEKAFEVAFKFSCLLKSSKRRPQQLVLPQLQM